MLLDEKKHFVSFRLSGQRENEGSVERRRGGWRRQSLMGKGRWMHEESGENRLSNERNPLACHGPCSVCISTVGMILGAEEGHCSFGDLPLYWKERWIEERKRRRQETERGLGCGVDPWPTLTCRHPPQLGLLCGDRALCDLLHVKSNP